MATFSSCFRGAKCEKPKNSHKKTTDINKTKPTETKAPFMTYGQEINSTASVSRTIMIVVAVIVITSITEKNISKQIL